MRPMAILITAVAALMGEALSGAVLAESNAFRYGTNAGDALYGTSSVDWISGLGGADLIYGYGSKDVLYGGDESGWGDKILGGDAADEVRGQRGDDALYGGRGNDKVYGGAGNDLVVGGPGQDTINSGPGPDSINARDGQKDTVICGNEYDRVFYDRGLDVMQGCKGISGSSRAATLSTEQPPQGLFEHTGKVLLDHRGAEQCVAANAVKVHVKHGDEIVNPAGCSGAEEGRR